jgi:hypothetical protein
MQYIWSPIGIESLKRNNAYESFSCPNEADILDDHHLDLWKKLIHDENLTKDKLVDYGLATLVEPKTPAIKSKPKPKPTKTLRKVVKITKKK